MKIGRGDLMVARCCHFHPSRIAKITLEDQVAAVAAKVDVLRTAAGAGESTVAGSTADIGSNDIERDSPLGVRVIPAALGKAGAWGKWLAGSASRKREGRRSALTFR